MSIIQKIFGPSVKFDSQSNKGRVKFADGRELSIERTKKGLAHVTEKWFRMEDEFIFKNKEGQAILRAEMSRPIYGLKAIFQGGFFTKPLIENFRDFMPDSRKILTKLGEKLAKKL